MDALAAVLREPVAEESEERLAAFNKATAGEVFPLVMGPGFREPVQVRPIKMFVEPRWKSVKDQLAGESQGTTMNR